MYLIINTSYKKKMIIDFSTHLISERLSKYISKRDWQRTQMRVPAENADPESRLALMEKYGVAIQALSPAAPIVYGFNPTEAAEICRISNEDNYSLCKAYPKNFINICMISLLEMKSAMAELERAVNELDCRAVTICSNQNGKGLDLDEFYPFYEKVIEYDLPIFIHPVHWDSYPLLDNHSMVALGWPFDTTQAVWRLISSGTLDRFPELKIVLHHYGGMVPFFSRRIEQMLKLTLKKDKDLQEYCKNLYADTALEGSTASYPCGYAFFGPERSVFGTDYPFGAKSGEVYYKDTLAAVKSMDITKEDMQKVLYGNAKKLLKINCE